MEMKEAINAFAALAQETRLDVFRLLIKAGEKGLPSGDIGQQLGVRPNTMSANLAVLLNAGLVRKERNGRMIRYFINLDTTRALLVFLLEDCCGGRPEFCRPMLEEIGQAAGEKP